MDITTFLGRLHPMVVHLPIGILLMAAFFDWLSYTSRFSYLRNAVAPALLAGFISGAVAAVLGYLLSLSGSYEDNILDNHRNAGILLVVVSGAWWLVAGSLFSPRTTHRRFTTAAGIVTVILLTYTGHQGGNLTHGSDYLSLNIGKTEERPKPDSITEALLFEDVVLPMLKQRCESCHRRGKRKGELIITSYADLMKGGESGGVVVAGRPQDSELYRRITLDPTHDDFMPTDGKTPLTDEETDVIRWWIEAGSASAGVNVVDVDGHEEMLAVVAALLGVDSGTAAGDGTGIGTKVNPDIPLSTDRAAVERLQKQGVRVRVMLHQPVMLDVTLPAGSQTGMDEIENDLRAVAANIVWLNLSGNQLTAMDLAVVKEMSNLGKLRLERNAVGDELADILKGLRHLEALNVNDTKVSKAGYLRLKEHPSLKRIYWWEP